MGVKADDEQKNGVPLLRPDGSVQRVPKFGLWEIEITPNQTDEWDVEEAARLLLRRLPESIETWYKLPSGASISLSFGLSLESKNQGFSIAPDISRYVSERNIRLDFDICVEEKKDS